MRHGVDAPSASGSASSAIDPPKWLKKGGRAVWDSLAPTLRAAKLLTPADQLTFARYCRNYADWLAARKQLDRDGMTYEAESYAGGAAAGDDAEAKPPQRVTKLRRLDPLFIVADRLERMLLAAEDRFGLNPAERQRIFVARSQTGVTGDLFAGADRRPDDPATSPAEPAQPIAAPIGFLN